MKKNLQKLVALTAISALTACGGGGSSSSTSTPQTGFFIDSAVEGLSYTTATQSGKTGTDGSFKYSEGESVSFSLYGKPLFSPKGFKYLTPFDLSDNSKNPAYSINLIRFFLAIDSDSNATNGIQIPEFSGTFDIDFNKSILDFAADTDGKISAFLIANASGRTLATVADAVRHFNDSMANISPEYVLSLAGKTATSSVKNTNCTNGVAASMRYTFSSTAVTLDGSDGFLNNGDGNCVVMPDDNEIVSYSSIPQGEFPSCAPTCDYKQLNNVSFIPNDADNRVAIEWVWHTPNTSTITKVKTILEDTRNNNHPASLNTFVELITLN